MERPLAALPKAGPKRSSGHGKLLRHIVRDRWLYIMLIPAALFYILFKTAPIGGLTIVLFDYLPPLGIKGSPFVGLGNIARLFSDPKFLQLFRNTILLAVYNLLLYFPVPLILSLMLNEIRLSGYKRTVQSFIYLPHFLSWTVLVGIVFMFLGPRGLANDLLASLGQKSQNVMASPAWFRPLVVMEVIWKEAGWGTIIYLAALSGVDEQLYEAAIIDGASRFRQLWHITLPSIKGTIVVLLILRLGNFMDTGFEQIYLMTNSLNRTVGDVFDTYVYTNGIQMGNFSYSTVIGLFKSVVSFVLVLGANKMAKLVEEEGIF
jgi:putative aldouronate transport system permease protein